MHNKLGGGHDYSLKLLNTVAASGNIPRSESSPQHGLASRPQTPGAHQKHRNGLLPLRWTPNGNRTLTTKTSKTLSTTPTILLQESCHAGAPFVEGSRSSVRRLPPTAHAIGDWHREKFLPALPGIFEAVASVKEALETAVLLDDVDAAGICVERQKSPGCSAAGQSEWRKRMCVR